MRGRMIAATMAGLVAAGAAAAPAPPPAPTIADPEAAIVEELVVVSRHPEPAWWRVEGPGGGVVHVLGAPDAPLPPEVTWRRQTLEQRLEGADRLIVAPRLHAGLEDLFGLIALYGQLRSKTPMEEGLAPPLAARFAADRERLGKGPEPYAHWRPFVAGLILLRDVRPQGSRDIGRQVHGEAARRGVPVKAAGEYDLVPFARTALASLTPASEGECLAAALDDAEQGPDAFRRAAAGWARGDVAVALGAPRHFDRCLLLMAGGPQLWRRSTDDLAEAIVEATAKPGGRAVAIVPLRRLLAKDGLIDTLRARGLKVIGPDDPAE
jgi:hypothetical protein